MVIALNSVVPKPLEGLYSSESIWGKSIQLRTSNYYLINAHSGKGKSTLLSYLYGIRNDFSGSICIDQLNIKELTYNNWSDIRKSQISIVFQDLKLFDDLSATQNILIKSQLTSSINESEMMDMAIELEVDHLLNKKVKHLSMGQQQRIALIRALSQPFKWLLLDEPFSHLDALNTAKMEALILRYCQKHSAGLILTSLGLPTSLPIQETFTV